MLFIETSSMVKLYIVESGSTVVADLVAHENWVACSWATYVEVRAALAAAYRGGRIVRSNYSSLAEEFEADWQRYTRMEVSRSIIVAAGALAEFHGLRGYDAIHLASAIRLQAVSDEPVQVVTHDRDLRDAVRAAGLGLLPLDFGA